MLFEVSDLDRCRRTHVGVLEFDGPEETCYMPVCVLELLCADVGDVGNLLLYIALVVICALIYNRRRATFWHKKTPAAPSEDFQYNLFGCCRDRRTSWLSLLVCCCGVQLFPTTVVPSQPARVLLTFTTGVSFGFTGETNESVSGDGMLLRIGTNYSESLVFHTVEGLVLTNQQGFRCNVLRRDS